MVVIGRLRGVNADPRALRISRRIVEESVADGASIAEVARRQGHVHKTPNQIRAEQHELATNVVMRLNMAT